MTAAFITDRDGYLANFQPAAQAVFSLADTDGDGELTRAEFVKFQQAFGTPEDQVQEAFTRLDTNGSGTLTVDELIAAAEQYYRGAEPDALGNWLFGPIA